MNGVYVNKVQIPVQQLVPLRVGDCLGVGALEATGLDYYLFDVLKNVVKVEVSAVKFN